MASKYEQSKTYQYRKVMKPLLERKRRARINKCLDDLKDLMGECMQQQTNDPSVKLEKADILELTVQHLRKLKMEQQQQKHHHHHHQQQQQQINSQQQNSFRSGYIQAANEVSRAMASLPNVDVILGTKLMTHLGLRLNQLESADGEQQPAIAITAPLTINITGPAFNSNKTTNIPCCSPVSSGYASDSDCSSASRASPVPSMHHIQSHHNRTQSTYLAAAGLLQLTAGSTATHNNANSTTPVWRPW